MNERLGREYFEDLYAKFPDPWNFETSEYERRKYRRTLESLDGRKFRRALEAGCSIGVFTEMLAPHCGELIAVDASDRAVSAARKRLESFSHLRVERRTLPEEMPEGAFDLIIASEVLYYLDREAMLDTLRIFENSLVSGGLLLAVHWRKETKTYPLRGDEVHDLIRSNTRLDHTKSESEPEYRLDLFERGSGGASLRDASGVGSRERNGGDIIAVEVPGRVWRESVERGGGSIWEEKVGDTPTPEASGSERIAKRAERVPPDSRRL
ncbi:MAG: methyltransferase [Rubrobacter sp.]|nr:methyltransferase [Rubrobacter sp.]